MQQPYQIINHNTNNFYLIVLFQVNISTEKL